MDEQSLGFVESCVREMDEALDPDTPMFRCAVVLLAAALVCGCDDCLTLRRFTEYPKYEVEDFYARFVKAGIFKDGVLYHGGWDDLDPSGVAMIAFWCDVLCGLGMVERRSVR